MRPIYRPEIQEGKERLESFSVDFRYKRANKGLKASQLTFATRGQTKAWKLLSWLSLLTLRTTAWVSKPLKGKERIESFSVDFRYKRAKKGLKTSQWLSLQEGKERLESFSSDFRYKRAKKDLKASQLTFATRGQRKAWKLLSWLLLQEGKERLESFSVDFRYKRAKKGLKASQVTFATRGQRKAWKLLSWISL